jgi:ribosomal protein S18 acetylase RimI-like enzyme
MAAPVYRLRPVTEFDRELLLRTYASTRADELAQVDWSQADKARFIESQFDAQAKHYADVYPDGEYDVIETPQGEAIGRLYMHRGRSDLRVIDITLLPEWRGQGLGCRILDDVLDEAAATQRTVSIHVEIFNPAQHLYERLGFVPIETRGLYRLMQWTPLQYPEVCHG